MSAAGKLKPCPLCGGDVVQFTSCIPKCSVCGASGEVNAGQEAGADLWNKRYLALKAAVYRSKLCVQALQHLSTEELESGKTQNLVQRVVDAERKRNELAEAARSCVAAFEDLFGQCCSNPVKNAWGKQVNFTKLNDANQLAQQSLRRLKGFVE